MSRKQMLPVLIILILALALPGVTEGQEGAGFPVPAGRIIAGDENGLFTILADGSEKTYLVEESEATCWLRDGAWHADGSKIVYTEICGGSSPTNWDAEDRTARVFVYDFADGSSTELIPPAESSDVIAQDYAGVWTPDGTGVVFYSNRTGTTFDLYLFDVATGDVNKLSTFDSDASRVVIDPTGRYLLYNRYNTEASQWDVRALDMTNNNEIFVAAGLTPAWSPDGQWITFATEGETADIFVMPAGCIYDNSGCSAETTAVNITYSPTIGERVPVFSPDQTELLYLRDTSPEPALETWDIYRQDLRTGQIANITNTTDIKERHSTWEPIETEERVDIGMMLPVVLRVNVAENTVNLRSEPSTTAEIVGQIPNGQLLFAQGKNENSSWYKITLPGDGSTAWVFANLVTVEGNSDTGNLPVVAE